MWRSIVLVVTAAAGVASAQPSPDGSPPPPPPTDPTSPAAPAGPAATAPIDPAWAEYDDVFARAAAGDTSDATIRLGALGTKYPGHPAARRAGELVTSLQPRPADPDAPSKLARGELAFWSTVSGVFIGANVCVMIDCSSERAAAGVYMASVGGSLAVSLALTRNGIRSGEAQLYNSAQTWGSWNGLAINDGFASTSGEAAVSLAAQAAGLGAGLALWQTWRPTQGDVALTNTFWVWSSVLTVWGHLAVDEDSLSFRRVVIAGDVGLVIGALVSTQVKMSRGRTFLIDVGGVLGTLGGALIASGTDSEEGAGTALMLGSGLGLVAGAALTRDWDAPQLPVTPAPIAGPQSTGLGLATHLSW